MAILTVIAGGIAGGLLTYIMTWVREHRRTLDAYRSPQREALGGIIAAAYEYRLRELDQRTAVTTMVEQMRRQEDVKEAAGRIRPAAEAMASAFLGVERAFRIAQLTVVDAPTWEAMGAAYMTFDRVRRALRSVGPNPGMETPEEIEQYIGMIASHVAEFGNRVDMLTPAANNRLTPAAETWRNRRRRRAARERLGEFYGQLHGANTAAPDESPLPHD